MSYCHSKPVQENDYSLEVSLSGKRREIVASITCTPYDFNAVPAFLVNIAALGKKVTPGSRTTRLQLLEKD